MNTDVIKAMYLSNEGRIGRLAYFGYSLALGIAYAIVATILGRLLGMAGLIIALILYIGLLYPQYNLASKRFHDLNQPSQYALYMIVAALIAGVLVQIASLHMIGGLVDLLVFIVFLYLLFMPGTAGANTYGAAPSAMPGLQ